MKPERCVFGVFFLHTGQHQPHDLVMTQGSMAARWGQDGAAHAKALGGDADEATTGDHVPCEGVQAPTM